MYENFKDYNTIRGEGDLLSRLLLVEGQWKERLSATKKLHMNTLSKADNRFPPPMT